MRKVYILALVALLSGLSAFSQVSSANMVGYMKGIYHPGKHLIVNSFHQGPPYDMLSEILYAAPTGTVVTVWDPTINSLGGSMTRGEYGWTDDFHFPIGSTAVLETPEFFEIIISGEVHDGDGENLSLQFRETEEFLTPSPFEALAGTYLKGAILPAHFKENSDSHFGVFQWVLGRDAVEGVSITRIDGETQVTWATTYMGNGAWDNGVPELEVGEAAYFTFPKNSTYGRVPDLSLSPSTNQVLVAEDGEPEEVENPMRIQMGGLYEGLEYRLSYTECLTNDWAVGLTFEADGASTNIWDLSFGDASSSNGFYKLEFVD